MNINIKGVYSFKQDGCIIFEGSNLITFYGESFFLNRCINNSYNPIRYIGIGNGESIPLRTDTSLGNETVKRTCIKIADLSHKLVKLTCSFTASEIVGTTEIGVYAKNKDDKDILISHDLFDKIDSRLLNNLSGSVEVEYDFYFSTSTRRTGWIPLEGYSNVYYLYEPNNVVGVIEDDVTGYHRQLNKVNVRDNSGSYYYDTITQNIYIHTSDGLNPVNHNILVQTKEVEEDIELDESEM